MARDPRRVLLLLAALLVGEAVVDQRDTGHLLQLFASVRPATVSPTVTTSLSVNCTSFRHGDSVSVSWNESIAHGGSFVAWHVPADSYTYGAAPLKFQPAGDGHLTFRLLNSRQPGRFVLYTGGLRSPVAVSVSQVITPEEPNEPTQIHLDSLGGAGALRVHWVTSNARLPTVRYGTSPGELTQASLASSRSYTAADLCGEPANGVGYLHPGTLHTAVLTDVTPGSLFYSVGDSAAPRDSLAWSPVYMARAPPSAGGGDVSALVSADVGTAEVDGSNVLSPEADDPAQRSWFSMLPSLDTAALMTAAVRREPGFPRTWANLSLWVHNGDISYALGYAGLWESFMDQFAPVMHVLPYHTAIGNHESNWPSHGAAFNGEDSQDSGGECGVPYIARMPPPGLQPNGARLSDAAPWYSFEAGPIHFVQSSTEHSYLEGSPQRVWLEADLAAVNRSVTPWLVFSGHRPFVIDSYFAGDGDIGATLRSALEPLWAEYGVDLTLAGHHHSYQRTCALMTGTQRPTCARPCSDGSNPAPVHVVTGNGGAGLTATQRWRPAHFSAVHREHGFALLDANATHLWLRSLRSSDGKLLDSVMLVRPRSGAVCAPVPVSFLRTIHPARVLAATAAICAAASALGGALYAVALVCSALRHHYLAAKAGAEQAAALQEPLLGEQTDTATGSEPAV